MRVAVLTSAERGADLILDDAIAAVRGSCGRIAVLVVNEEFAVSYNFGGMPGALAAPIVREDEPWPAAAVARELVDRLPADINATHAAFRSWRCPALLGQLRSGELDRVLLGDWPASILARRKVVRATRTGGADLCAPPALH